MVYLILTRTGYVDLRPRFDFAKDILWVNAGVLTDEECSRLRADGCNLTTFANPLNTADLSSDVATIAEHHPNKTVWIEGKLNSED